MKIILLALLSLVSAELYAGGEDSAEIQQPELSFSAEMDLCSSYIYRGIVLNRNLVSQSGFTAYYGNFSAGVWCNLNSATESNPVQLSETDVWVTHDFSILSIDITSAAVMYIYSGADHSPSTAEYSLNAAYSGGPIRYFSNFTVDFMEYTGSFIFSHGICWEKELSGKLGISASLSLSWAGKKYNLVNTGLEKTALNYAGIDISFTYTPARNFYLQPHLQFNRVIDKELREYIDKQSSFFGILSGYTF